MPGTSLQGWYQNTGSLFVLDSLEKTEVSRNSRKIFKEKRVKKKYTGKKFFKKAFKDQVTYWIATKSSYVGSYVVSSGFPGIWKVFLYFTEIQLKALSQQ